MSWWVANPCVLYHACDARGMGVLGISTKLLERSFVGLSVPFSLLIIIVTLTLHPTLDPYPDAGIVVFL